MTIQTRKLEFQGHDGATLAARLDEPAGKIRAYALFAHCFTCSKDILAARRIANQLAQVGIAVLRFDFTGLGSSEGEFGNTNFSSNVADLVHAAEHLRHHHQAPSILIGHSLGGAAVLAAAESIPEAKGVVTIGAPADAEHVIHNFGAAIDAIDANGTATVELAGRPFTIKKQFLDDVRGSNLEKAIGGLHRELLVMHAPLDQTVSIENATRIFVAAKHPKSFISLDKADHLLSREEDASYAANMIAAWAGRFLPIDQENQQAPVEDALVVETGVGKFQNQAYAGNHSFFADEPKSVGGLDSGPSPYDFLAVALASCTSMTLRMYADFKKIDLGRISVRVDHKKVHAKDCADCTDEQLSKGGKIDRFVREISIEGDLPAELETKVIEIADKCPVHRTLERGATVITEVIDR